MFWLLIILAAAGGTLATYFYDEDAHFLTRLAAGAATGLAALGLFGFLFASLAGFNATSIILATLVTAAPLAMLSRADWRARVRFDVKAARRDLATALNRPGAGKTAAVVLLLVALFVFWLVFNRAMFRGPDVARAGGSSPTRVQTGGGEAIFTGVDNNLGDLPFHLAIISGFVHGENFPPAHPEFAGARLTYPFTVDFVAAMFVRAGASIESALFWENLLLALSLVVLLYRLALRLTGDRLAAGLACVLTLLSGGLGWVRFLREASDRGVWEFLWRLPHDYTITYDGVFRWGNAVTTLLVPQRGLLMGLPLALIVITQWWLATRGDAETAHVGDDEELEGKGKGKRGKAKKHKAHEPGAAPKFYPFNLSPLPFSLTASELRMLGAGVVAGLLPLVHAHSFVVLMLLAGCLALLLRGWRGWLIFFGAAFLIAAPQMFWATRESAARPASFFEFVFGWDRGEQNALWFWFKNTGAFIPLLVAALAWRGESPLVPKRLLIFYLPFTLLFVICNVAKISPWVWDNIKVLFYWYVASVPLVALLLARLWRWNWIARVGAAALALVLTFAGALDVWRVVSRASQQREFDAGGIAFAELVRRETRPRSLVVHAPTYNHPMYLTGRQSLMGYPGHLWSQGIDHIERETEIRRIYAGSSDAPELLVKHNVEYAVVGPLERSGLQVNESFFSRFQKVGEAGGYRLYKVRP